MPVKSKRAIRSIERLESLIRVNRTYTDDRERPARVNAYVLAIHIIKQEFSK